MTIAFIHVFLSEVVKCTYNDKSKSNDGNLVMAPVNYRINASHFSGVDGAGVTGGPVKAKGSCYCCSCRKTANTQANQDGVHSNHQKHCQTGSTVDAQTNEHTSNPSTGQYEVGGFQRHQGFNGHTNQGTRCANFIHVTSKRAYSHNVEAKFTCVGA